MKAIWIINLFGQKAVFPAGTRLKNKNNKKMTQYQDNFSRGGAANINSELTRSLIYLI